MVRVHCNHFDCPHLIDGLCDAESIDVGWCDELVGCPHMGNRFRITGRNFGEADVYHEPKIELHRDKS